MDLAPPFPNGPGGAPVRYPDPAVRVIDPRFERYRIGSAAVERLATGCRWAEGPVWFGDHRCLLWSDIPNNRILRWSETTGAVDLFRSPSNFANGHTRDREGRLVSCEHLTRRVTRTEHDGSVTVLLEVFAGAQLNAPNDVVVRSDGSIWFTDPGYGILSNYEGDEAEPTLPTTVYRLDPATGEAEAVVTSLERPNGLCFSPDEQRLYVVDSGPQPSLIHVFSTVGRALGDARVFAEATTGGFDGIRSDIDGNVWAAVAGGAPGSDGVQIYAPDGALIGQIDLPEQCANICFGGRRGNRLFMAASQSVYSLYVNTRGATWPSTSGAG